MARGEIMYTAEAEKAASRAEQEIAKLTSVSNKQDVKVLQKYLKNELKGYDLGEKLKVDGEFGPITKEYLKAHVDMSVGSEYFPNIVKAIESNLQSQAIEGKLMDGFIEDAESKSLWQEQGR